MQKGGAMNKKILILIVVLILMLGAAFFLLRGPLGPSDKQAAAATQPAPSANGTAAATPVMTTAPDVSANVLPESGLHKYIFIMIGDGMGEAQRSLAQGYAAYKGGKTPLIMNSLPVTGTVTTNSLNADITDSAAAATAYATGHKTNNGMLSVTPDGQSLKTVIEEAEDKGLSTGLVTTTTLSNATPAAFAAHAQSRASEADIALQYLDSGVDFFAGGGDKYFLPSSYSGGSDALGVPLASSRGDNRDLVSEFEDAGYKTFIGLQGAQDFAAYVPSAGDKVLASFTNDYTPYELDRTGDGLTVPSLAGMTEKAIETLGSDEDGFVLMVEGGRIDHTCAANDPAGAVNEALAFNDAVQQAYGFYNQHPEETLIIVMGDHETGGLKLGDDLDLSHIAGVKLSVTERLHVFYTGDRQAYYAYLAANFGLGDLNPSEKQRIEDALDFADSADYAGEYQDSPASVVAAILSKRVGVEWAGKEHTGVPVPLYAVGLGADAFSGDKDNTEIGQILFDALGRG